MNPDKVKHLELIQNVVARMAGNSFLLKGWSITLIAGLFALASKDASQAYVGIAFLPSVFFWGLDAYYLRQERLFRALYDEVRSPASGIDAFSMDTSPVANRIETLFQTAIRPAVIYFHWPLLATILAVLLLAF